MSVSDTVPLIVSVCKKVILVKGGDFYHITSSCSF